MFITLTINTTKNKNKIRIHKKKLSPTNGWRRSTKIKKTSMFQRVKGSLKKTFNTKHYYLDGNMAMY